MPPPEEHHFSPPPPPPPLTHGPSFSSQASPRTPFSDPSLYPAFSPFTSPIQAYKAPDPGLPPRWIRQYVCSECSGAFFQPEQLQQHQRLHALQNALKCPECGHQFARHDLLLRHQKDQHGSPATKRHIHNDPNHSKIYANLNRLLYEVEQRKTAIERLLLFQSQTAVSSPNTTRPQGALRPAGRVGSSRDVHLSRSQSATAYINHMSNVIDRNIPQAPVLGIRSVSDQGMNPNWNISNHHLSTPHSRFGPFTSITNPALNRSYAPPNHSLQGEPSQRPPSALENTPLSGVGVHPSEFLEQCARSQNRSEPSLSSMAQESLSRSESGFPPSLDYIRERAFTNNHFQSSDLGIFNSNPSVTKRPRSSSFGSTDTGVSHPPRSKKEPKKLVQKRYKDISSRSLVQPSEQTLNDSRNSNVDFENEDCSSRHNDVY